MFWFHFFLLVKGNEDLRVEELPPTNIGIIPDTLLSGYSVDHSRYISELPRGSRKDQSCDTFDISLVVILGYIFRKKTVALAFLKCSFSEQCATMILSFSMPTLLSGSNN